MRKREKRTQAAALLAGALIEAAKGFRKAEPNLGGTTDFMNSSRIQYLLYSGLFLFL